MARKHKDQFISDRSDHCGSKGDYKEKIQAD